jgi:hypothetical protein
MQNTLKTHFRIWLVLGLAALALLTLAFQSGEDTEPAHCHSCKTPTHTPTATSTSIPPSLQACRIEAIYFNEQLYSPGETITASLGSPLAITIKLVDQQGQILIGANVDATVTQTDTVQAAAIPPLDDQSGTYDAVYTPANAGLYRFTFSASDFTGPRFLPCSAEALVRFEGEVQPTPPPVTSTVRIDLDEPELELCGRANPDTASTVVATATNLAEVDLTITFDPTFIIPIKITPIFGPGTISRTNNTLHYTARKTSPVSGTIDLLHIDWRLQGRDGVTTMALTSILKGPNGTTIPHADQNGTLKVVISPPCLRCTVNLQGRSNHSGVTITSATGQTTSYANGLFVITSAAPWQLTSPGYLSAELDVSLAATNSCRANLLAGDVTGNNLVDILDLAYLAQHYQSADPTADLNVDGMVNILDLALASGNYQRRGPLPGGQ